MATIFHIGDERELLARLANGDEEAYTRLLRRYWNSIYSMAITYLKSPQQAQDIVQDVFLKLWDKREQLTEVEKPEAWLFTVARNLIIDGFRKKIAAPLPKQYIDIPESEALSPFHLYEQKQVQRSVHEAIDLLPATRREIFLLSRNEGLTYEEIADRLKLSHASVKGHIAKALNFIREYLSLHTDHMAYLLILVFAC